MFFYMRVATKTIIRLTARFKYITDNTVIVTSLKFGSQNEYFTSKKRF